MASITSEIHSVDIPVIYGYNVIKEGPYSLAVFGGPKFRYIWNKKSEVTFENFDQQGIKERLRPLNPQLHPWSSRHYLPHFLLISAMT